MLKYEINALGLDLREVGLYKHQVILFAAEY
jgi:hypothetical protein